MSAKASRRRSPKEIFWCKRAEHYDKLYWVRDKSYLDAIIERGDFRKGQVVLDVGVGTGTVAKKIKPHVKHVIGLDISDSMLSRSNWEGISLVKWDVCQRLFDKNVFDRIVARMVFHHILDDLDGALKRCFDMLKPGGKIIIAEGLPPSDDPGVVKWYEGMFALKEERRTFTERELYERVAKAGFRNIAVCRHIMHGFSVRNWLANSGLPKEAQHKIMDMHMNAGDDVKGAYGMRIVGGDCLINTRNVIVIGEK
ncbi:MAG: methyltransferase domain-containing protein [Candidatus Aenigmarchaeota archaeon]|nr:methyltransferase domain-containing protein [Candidatus Aenigmarchaeota archaeon]